MADWSNLPKDVVHVVADLLLATNDVDCYVDMRAVCRNWRVTVPKPTPLGAGDDGRFRPREWVMLDEKEPEDGVDGRLFLHVSTGRFVRRRLPSFGFDSRSKYILVGSSDGLLILGDQKGLHAARLLNPFTGDMLSFAAPIPRERHVIASVAGSSPTILFTFKDMCNDCTDMVYCADATSPLCEVQIEVLEEEDVFLKSIVSYAGHLYVLDCEGAIHKIVGTAPNYHAEFIAQTHGDCSFRDFFLAGSAGELLLVALELTYTEEQGHQDLVDVFRVNIEQKVLEPVRNIGSQALFLGPRCLSVDADKLPHVDRNCIYYTLRLPFSNWDSINRYDLKDSKVESIRCMLNPATITRQMVRPFSLAQALIEYCGYEELEDVPSQLQRVRNTRTLDMIRNAFQPQE